MGSTLIKCNAIVLTFNTPIEFTCIPLLGHFKSSRTIIICKSIQFPMDCLQMSTLKLSNIILDKHHLQLLDTALDFGRIFATLFTLAYLHRLIFAVRIVLLAGNGYQQSNKQPNS